MCEDLDDVGGIWLGDAQAGEGGDGGENGETHGDGWGSKAVILGKGFSRMVVMGASRLKGERQRFIYLYRKIRIGISSTYLTYYLGSQLGRESYPG